MEFSTWKFRSGGESRRTIDHVWWAQEGVLQPVRRWRMLSCADIGPCGLPSAGYGSDHVAVCCDFKWLEGAPAAVEGRV